MTRVIDEGLWGIIEDACKMDDLSIYKDYTGPWLTHQACIGVVAYGGNYADVIRFMVNVVEALDSDITQQKNWLITLAESMTPVNSGQNIIYYFPGWSVT